MPKKLLTNYDNKPEVMYIIKLFIEKFYENESSHLKSSEDDSLKRIETVFNENHSQFSTLSSVMHRIFSSQPLHPIPSNPQFLLQCLNLFQQIQNCIDTFKIKLQVFMQTYHGL